MSDKIEQAMGSESGPVVNAHKATNHVAKDHADLIIIT